MSNNKIIIITAPSGAGKTSISKYLLEQFLVLDFAISAATRLPRGNEKNGVDYYFIDTPTFQQKIEQHEFIEWEMVYEGKYYGTLKSELERIWNNGKIPILDIDVKGAIHVQHEFFKNTLSIFIEPPTINELRKRLEMRGTETPENIEMRVSKAAYEISFNHHFNLNIINNNLETACQEARVAIENFIDSK
jgi:guanylate kinase